MAKSHSLADEIRALHAKPKAVAHELYERRNHDRSPQITIVHSSPGTLAPGNPDALIIKNSQLHEALRKVDIRPPKESALNE
jgi:hypothetical protein